METITSQPDVIHMECVLLYDDWCGPVIMISFYDTLVRMGTHGRRTVKLIRKFVKFLQQEGRPSIV